MAGDSNQYPIQKVIALISALSKLSSAKKSDNSLNVCGNNNEVNVPVAFMPCDDTKK